MNYREPLQRYPRPHLSPVTMESATGVATSRSANPQSGRIQPQATAVFLIVSSLFFSSAVVAAKNWSINPGISLSETYSDHVAPSSAQIDEADFVTQINPELRAELNGRRIQADLNYRMQNIQYARNSERSTQQQYLAGASAEILPEHFFIDTSSTLTQRNINTNGVRVNNNYAITDNRADQLTASIRPSWHQPMGSYAEALLDYEHGIVRFSGDGVSGTTAPDSRLDATSLTINSLSGARRLSWKFNVQGQQIVYDNSAFDDLKLRNTGLQIGYRIIPTLSPLALIGYDDNDFGNRLTSTDPTGTFWALGFHWQPNARSELEYLTGHRFFGNTHRITWRQRGRYITSELSYSEEISGEASVTLKGVSLIDNPGVYSNSNLGVTGDVFISKIARASARYEKSRTSITLTPFSEKREFENSRQENIDGISGTWEWAFAPRDTLALNLHWDKTDASAGNNQTFSWSELQLERQLGKQASASIGYSFTKSDSDNKQVAYTENALSAQLTYRFGTPAQQKPEPSTRHSGKQRRELQF